MALLFESLSRSVIGSFYDVYNRLGYGLLENPYVGALALDLIEKGHRVEREAPVRAYYKGAVVGSYRADLRVDRQLIVEVKAAPVLTGVHERQLLNYLRCSEIEVGIIVCFGMQPQFRRFIDTADRKRSRQIGP